MWEKEIIINVLNTGHENAISYDEVKNLTGVPRRIMRRLVEETMLDDSDICIGNMQDGRGYFIFDLSNAEDRHFALNYVRQEESRAYSRLRSLYKLKAKLRSMGYDFREEGEGERFKAARLLAGMTLRDASEKSGFGAPVISKIENNQAAPTLNQRICLSNVYGVEL